MSVRVSLPTRDLIDDVAEREGISIREVIERAVANTWGRSASSPTLVWSELTDHTK
jgi:hypothetical protein